MSTPATPSPPELDLNMASSLFFNRITREMSEDAARTAKRFGQHIIDVYMATDVRALTMLTMDDLEEAKNATSAHDAWVKALARRLGIGTVPTPATRQGSVRPPRFLQVGELTLGELLMRQGDFAKIVVPRSTFRGIEPNEHGVVNHRQVKLIAQRLFLFTLAKYGSVHGDKLYYRKLARLIESYGYRLPNRGTAMGSQRHWWKVIKNRFENGRRMSADVRPSRA